MGASAADIATLRKFTAAGSEYTDQYLKSVIERYPLPDWNGNFPTMPDGTVNSAWTPRYDLNAAAADIWEEKVATMVGSYDFEADGASFSRSQIYEQAVRQVRYYRSRSSVKTLKAQAYPKPENKFNDQQ